MASCGDAGESEEEDQEFKVTLVYTVSQPRLPETLLQKQQGKKGRNWGLGEDEGLGQMSEEEAACWVRSPRCTASVWFVQGEEKKQAGEAGGVCSEEHTSLTALDGFGRVGDESD